MAGHHRHGAGPDTGAAPDHGLARFHRIVTLAPPNAAVTPLPPVAAVAAPGVAPQVGAGASLEALVEV